MKGRAVELDRIDFNADKLTKESDE
jgi:hypothetical protein